VAVTKAFSKELYDQDDNAKHQILDWLIKKGYQAKINPDQYGIDILAKKDGILQSFEVEVKHPWKGDEFPFPEGVDLPPRKKKFAKPNSFFVMLNHERTRALIFSGLTVMKSPVVVKDTIYTSAERFIRVPLDACDWIELGESNG